MKVAIQYSGFLRFIKDTYPNLIQMFVANEPIEFYIFIHTWDSSNEEDIQYMIEQIKPHRYYIDSQKNFERHPYIHINADETRDKYENNPDRIEWNRNNPNNMKKLFDFPSESNNYKFDKDLQVIRFYHYSHFPYNTLSLFYSMHQVNLLSNSYEQENNLSFDYVIRMRTDLAITKPINLSYLNQNEITLFDAAPHSGELGKYTTHDQFAVGNSYNMKLYNDLFVYLPTYYFIFKLDWVSEILLGFHLQYNKLNISKIPRNYQLLRYTDRDNSRPTK